MTGQTITLVIDSQLDKLALVGAALRGLCAEWSVSSELSNLLELCVVEAVTNSIKHAYDNEAGRPVHVEVGLDGDRIRVAVLDQGNPMPEGQLERAPADFNDPDPDDLDSLLTSGRGLILIKEIMDEVGYQSVNGWNRFSMIRRM
jgi:serine/threonine-protein kinase RsbW